MSDIFEIPKRTIENWEQGSREPAPWAEKLVVAELKRMVDPFYSPENQKVLDRSVRQLEEGHGKEHKLIED